MILIFQEGVETDSQKLSLPLISTKLLIEDCNYVQNTKQYRSDSLGILRTKKFFLLNQILLFKRNTCE